MGEAILTRKGGGVDASDATANATNILSGKTAYIDDSGDAKTGTMTNRTNTSVTAVSSALGSSYAVTPASGYYDGSTAKSTLPLTTVASALGISSEKIVQGNTICGVVGTFDVSGGIINFPYTISSTQPTAIRNGHIWVNTTRITSAPTIHVVESITSSISNNSLIFVVGDLTDSNVATWGISSGTYGNANNFLQWYRTGTHSWVAGNTPGKYETYLNVPLVYTKINGLIYIETAYMWNGSSWVNISNADKYVLGAPYNTTELMIYNVGVNNTLSFKSTGLYSKTDGVSASPNGQFFAGSSTSQNWAAMNIYKRTGDTFALFQTIDQSEFSATTGTFYYTKDTILFSQDGTNLVIGGYSSDTGVWFVRYSLNANGAKFSLVGCSRVISRSDVKSMNNMVGNSDLSVILFQYIYNPSSTNYINAMITHGTVSSGYSAGVSVGSNTDSSGSYSFGISPSGRYFFAATYNSGTCGVFDLATKTPYYIKVSNTSYTSKSQIRVNDSGEAIYQIYKSEFIGDNEAGLAQIKISISGTTVSYELSYASHLKLAQDTSKYNKILDITFRNKDQSYVLMSSGTSSNNSADTLYVFKLVYNSSGIISSYTLLTTLSGVSLSHHCGKLIGWG